MTDPPILILGMPRSGTSMVAGVFAQHGVWVGTSRGPDHANQKGHYENEAIKKLQKRWWGPTGQWSNIGWEPPTRPDFRSEVERLIEEDGYQGGPWLFKCSPVFWRSFRGFHPKAWICVRRDTAAIIASGKDSGFFLPEGDAIKQHVRIMDELVHRHDAVDVDADEVIRGEYATLEHALERAGIEPNRALIEGFVEPSLWRH